MSSMNEVMKKLEARLNKSKISTSVIYNPGMNVERISSGEFIFDIVTNGGFPKGRVSEIFGLEGTGKTTLLFTCYADVLRRGGTVIHFDFECSTIEDYYKKLGVDLEEYKDNLKIFQPLCIEDAEPILEEILELDNIDIIGFDSLEAMKPLKLLEAGVGDPTVGLHARAVGTFVSKLRKKILDKNLAVVFINQIRSEVKLNPYAKSSGLGTGFIELNNETTPGGKSFRFMCSLRVKLEYAGKEDDIRLNPITGKEEKVVCATRIKIVCVKTKVGKPFLKGETFLNSDTSRGSTVGFDSGQAIINTLKNMGRIKQASRKFTYNGLNKNWENVDTKSNSEFIFKNSPELIEDAKQLILGSIDNEFFIEKNKESYSDLIEFDDDIDRSLIMEG